MTKRQKLKEQFPQIREGEPLKNHSMLRVGGPADLFYELTNIEELPQLLTLAEENQIPYKIIGRGTNILFTDRGFRGLIIKNLTCEHSVNGNEITADGGLLLSQIIKISVENNLTGLEQLYGLPGTIGGAVFGNAGIPGTEIGKFVKNVVLFDVGSGIQEIPGDQINFSYRHSSIQNERKIIMRVTLTLLPGEEQKSKDLIKKIDIIRRGKQPTGYSAGSFFKNPMPDKSAGYLIEQVGLKGYSIGDAQISPKHANFLMNKKNATADEILRLADLAKQKVKDKFGINLETEVKIVGDL